MWLPLVVDIDFQERMTFGNLNLMMIGVEVVIDEVDAAVTVAVAAAAAAVDGIDDTDVIVVDAC